MAVLSPPVVGVICAMGGLLAARFRPRAFGPEWSGRAATLSCPATFRPLLFAETVDVFLVPAGSRRSPSAINTVDHLRRHARFRQRDWITAMMFPSVSLNHAAFAPLPGIRDVAYCSLLPCRVGGAACAATASSAR